MSGDIHVEHLDIDDEPLKGEVVFAVEYVLTWAENVGGKLRIPRAVRCASKLEADSLIAVWRSSWPASDLEQKPFVKKSRIRFARRQTLVIGIVNSPNENEDDVRRDLLQMVRQEWPFSVKLV